MLEDGPSDSAGKNVSAPTMMMTPTSSPQNSSDPVGNVPGPGCRTFLFSIDPAIDRTGTIIRKRPASIANPSVTFQKACLHSGPQRQIRCFPAPLENAYRISDRPCGPLLFSDDSPGGATAAQPAKPKITSGKISTYSMDSVISFASIFFPGIPACGRPSARRQTRQAGQRSACRTGQRRLRQDDFAKLDVQQRHQPPSGVKLSCIAFTAPHGHRW